jgi:HEAT repeat protein
MERLEDLEQTLEKWRSGHASLGDIRVLSRELGKQHFLPGILALVQLLDHEDEIVRYNAAKGLGFHLRHKPATDKLLVMLGEDADEDVRSVAAGALRTIWQNTKEPRILKALAKAALTDTDEDLRIDAYRALLIVNGVPREKHLQLLTDESLQVDPSSAKAIVDAISQ